MIIKKVLDSRVRDSLEWSCRVLATGTPILARAVALCGIRQVGFRVLSRPSDDRTQGCLPLPGEVPSAVMVAAPMALERTFFARRAAAASWVVT